MIRLAYFSSAAPGFAAEYLGPLLTQARSNNLALGVTGLLCHHDGSFLQFLEGDPDAVDTLFERIGRDPRHRDVLLMHREPTETRAFSEWAMALVNPSALTGAEQAFARRLRDLDLGARAADHPELEPLLRAFRAWLR